ncbi:sugar ABC transporter permease [Lactiplantibacillus plantarum]|nr:sugar ABC transporter permease [Lactiplantibacillus plantarum]
MATDQKRDATTYLTSCDVNVNPEHRGIFRSDFGLFYLIPRSSGTLINVTQTFDTYIYRALTTTNDIGMSTAAGLMQSVVGALLIIICNWVVRRKQPESALF